MIGIFSEMVNDSMDIFMDDFTPYGSDFEEALKNLENVLVRCQQTHLSLCTEKVPYDDERGCSSKALHLCRWYLGRPIQNQGN